jgi:hypothetical protein
LHRQYALRPAEAIVAMLNRDAEVRLRTELSDPSNFGMAKSFFMQGQQAGFDMTTQEGMEAFMLAYNARLGGLPSPQPLFPPPFDDEDDFDDEAPGFRPPSAEIGPTLTPKQRAEARNKKRKARKEQKKSKKRNRK